MPLKFGAYTGTYPAPVPPGGTGTPPTVVLVTAPSTTGFAPHAVIAQGFGSSAGSSAITSYSFDFGDGTTISASQSIGGAAVPKPIAYHRYTTPGVYTLTMTVGDVNGNLVSTTRTITVSAVPAATVTVNSGDDVIAALNTAPAGVSPAAPTVIQINTGTYPALSTYTPKNNQLIKANGVVTITGGGTRLYFMNAGTFTGLIVSGIRFTAFTTWVVQTSGSLLSTSIWKDCEFDTNGTNGQMTGAINAYQSLSLVLDNCHIHGSNAYGLAGSQGTKIYYIGGEYDHNFMDTSGAINPNSDDGAHKNTHTPASYYVGAHVHDNQGQGLWWDHSNVNVYVALCNVHDNYGPGLFCEINDAAAGGDANNVAGNLDGSGFSFRFVFNTLTNNAAYPPVSGFYPTGNIYPSNLRVSRSNKLEIAYNIIADGTHALVLDFSTARGTAGHDLADIAVHDNDMLLRETASEPSANKRIGRVGFANSGGGGIPALVNVTFANNHYFADHDDSSWTHFMVEPSDADKTFTQWKALGYDTASTWAARAAWPH